MGKDFLERSYFNGNFKLDLFTLTHYIPRKDFVTLFDCIQNIYNLEEEMQTGLPCKKEKMQTLLSMISLILFNCIKTKLYTIDGIDNKIKYINSNECMAEAITLYLGNEKITFNFYNQMMFKDLDEDIKVHTHKKEIN